MHRRETIELLDDPSLPEEVVADAYRDLARTHRWLGNTRAILNRLKAVSAQSVLDLGCGQGALLEEIRAKLGVQVMGIDLRPAPKSSRVPIVTGDAVNDPLPSADVTLAICMVHHLSEAEIARLIRNVSCTSQEHARTTEPGPAGAARVSDSLEGRAGPVRASHRLIILDLVRHWLPLWLFRIFVSPFLTRINRVDGATSVQRAYTPAELRRIVDSAVAGTGARVRHTVAPFYTRQIIEISW